VLKDGLAKFTGTILVEPHYVCKDHRNLYSNFYSKKLDGGSTNCCRLHFFSGANITSRSFYAEPDAHRDLYIGYSVIRPVAQRSLGRSVFDPDRVGYRFKDGFYCLRTPFPVHVNGKRLSVSGYPYISQDTDATVCAHATLWGVCRYFSQRHASYAEILPYDLVKLTATTTGRVVPYRGMTYLDYSKILSDFGCHPAIIRLKETVASTSIDEDSFREMYSYVESGIPVLASFHKEGYGHVAALVGHTLDYDREYQSDSEGVISSASFVKQFIVIDDNFFPYRLLGAPGDPQNYFANHKPQFDLTSILTAVCPLPEKVYLPARKAERQARTWLRKLMPLYTAEHGPIDSEKDPIVARLFFTTGSSLKKRKLQMASAAKNGLAFDRISAFIADIRLPHFVWIMEIGSLSRYRAGYCGGEIAIDATANELEDSAIYARMGSTLILADQETTLESPKHFPQYTHNLGER